MKRLLLSATLCALPMSAIIAPPAAAQLFGGGIVYDPANHTQNILTAVRSLQQINQQIQQLTHEIEMLENMARDLESLPDSIADDILRRMRRIDELMREAEGIGYGVEEIEPSFMASLIAARLSFRKLISSLTNLSTVSETLVLFESRASCCLTWGLSRTWTS